MAIPEGYRLLRFEDMGKTFGVDLENTVYFDTSVYPIGSDNVSTNLIISFLGLDIDGTSYSFIRYDTHHSATGFSFDIEILSLDTDTYSNVYSRREYPSGEIYTSEWTLSSYTIPDSTIDYVLLTETYYGFNWLYVKDISEDPKGIISKSKLTPIFNKAREKTGTTDKYTLGDIPGIMDELEKVSVWEGTREESNTDNLDITENNYNVLTNKNKITFNTAQQKMEDVLNVYFTIEVSSTEEMNSFLEQSTAGRVFKYVGTTGTYTNGSYYKVNANNEYEEVVVLNLQEKTATPTKSEQEITPDSTYNGLGKVVVNPIPSNYIEPSGTIELTTLGEHDVTQYAKANVNVPASAFEDSIYEELNEMTFGEGE